MFRKNSDPIPIPEYLPPQVKHVPKTVTITINNQEFKVSSESTILEACTQNGIYVPTLCHHPRVAPTGRCGVCIVQVAGNDPPLANACKTHVKNGMTIFTNTPEVLLQQKTNLKHFLGSKESESFPEMYEIEDLIEYVKSPHTKTYQNSEKNPSKNRYATQGYSIVRNQDACIRCTRCVRVCSNIQNMNILEIDTEHPSQPIGYTGGVPIEDSHCISCGQCTLVCPTEAVSERNDIAMIDKLLREKESVSDGKSGKIMIVQVGPEAQMSVGEAMGTLPEKSRSSRKVVAALRAIGFDYVFDTCFGADMAARLEAKELTKRLKEGGPWPMFSAACPAWTKLIEYVIAIIKYNKYPHLAPLLSCCKSPALILGAMIRKWMEHQGYRRKDYVLVAISSCISKKEEIAQPENKNSNGIQDVDVVLTVRELKSYLQSRNISFDALPGDYKSSFDPPFNVHSGAGALAAVSGGVMEGVLRESYSFITKEPLNDPKREMYSLVRRVPPPGEWVEAEVDITPKWRGPGTHVVDSLVVSGGRAVQDFLAKFGLDKPSDGERGHGYSGCNELFVECMICPGGCIGGGGQPHTLDGNILSKRRKVVYKRDEKCGFASPKSLFKTMDLTSTLGISNKKLISLLEYEPSIVCISTNASLKASGSEGSSVLSQSFGSTNSPKFSPGFSPLSHTMDSVGYLGTSNGSFNAKKIKKSSSFLGLSSNSFEEPNEDTYSSYDTDDEVKCESEPAMWGASMNHIAVIYGSQAGFTASRAKEFARKLGQLCGPGNVSLRSMDQVTMDELASAGTIVALTSTWENDYGLMPDNAKNLWSTIQSLPLSSLGSCLSAVRYAVCGFGSVRYPAFCGFAIQLHNAFHSLGAQPIMPCNKVDVSTPDEGLKEFGCWISALLPILNAGSTPPAPRLLLVPSVIAGGGAAAPPVCAKGFMIATVARVVERKNGDERIAYVELNTGHRSYDPIPGQCIQILPSNPKKEVVELLNALYPGMTQGAVSPIRSDGSLSGSKHGNSGDSGDGGIGIPPHLTVRQLFEYFVELKRRPNMWFVRTLHKCHTNYPRASVVWKSKTPNQQQAVAPPPLDDPVLFVEWAKNKTYFDVLWEYKESVPSVEVLISMLPSMRPRSYLPVHYTSQSQDDGSINRKHILGFYVKVIPGGLCSNYLSSLSVGDKVMFSIGKSDFHPPTDAFFSGNASKQTVPALQLGTPDDCIFSMSGSSQSGSSESRGSDDESNCDNSEKRKSRLRNPVKMLSPRRKRTESFSAVNDDFDKVLAAATEVPLEKFPLGINGLSDLFHEKLNVGQATTKTFNITNSTRSKMRFMVSVSHLSSPKFSISVDPSNGVIKPAHGAPIKITLTMNCTTTCKSMPIHFICEEIANTSGFSQIRRYFPSKISSGGNSGSGLSSQSSQMRTTLSLRVESKLSPKIDYDEIAAAGDPNNPTATYNAFWRGKEVVVQKAHKGKKGDDFEARFTSLYELRSPYISPLIGYCLTPNGNGYVALTELSLFGNLTSVIKKTELTNSFRMKAACDIARGMAYLHSCGIVHGSLHPNAIIMMSLEMKESFNPNFVLCKVSGYSLSVKTPKKLSSIIEREPERLPYCAPELLESKTCPSMGSDIFSFGMVLYTLMTGNDPYPKTTSPDEIVELSIAGKRPPLDGVKTEIASLIKNLWSPNIPSRPSFDVVVSALSRYENRFYGDRSGALISESSSLFSSDSSTSSSSLGSGTMSSSSSSSSSYSSHEPSSKQCEGQSNERRKKRGGGKDLEKFYISKFEL